MQSNRIVIYLPTYALVDVTQRARVTTRLISNTTHSFRVAPGLNKIKFNLI